MDKNDIILMEMQARIIIHGFTFIGVFAEGPNPAFVYSAGLTAVGWPEVIMIGNMRPNIVEIILTDLIESWKRNNNYILGDNPGLIAFRDGSSHPLRVVEVDPAAALSYACAVDALFPDDDLEFVQVLWPDTTGKFPGEDGYDNERCKQPLIKAK